MVKVAGDKIDLKRGIDHIGVSAGAIVHDGRGRILLQKRGPKARDEQGHWDNFGGAIEFGEPIVEALSRELYEELLTEPLKIQFLTVYDVFREFNGRPTHWIAILHAAQVDPGKISIGEPEKIAELGWFTSETLPQPLHSQFSKSYTAALQKGIVK